LNINGEKLMEAILKALVVGVMGFGVSYLRGIGQDTNRLNLTLMQLKYEIRALSENQNSVNKEIMLKLSSHEHRIDGLEKHRK